MGEIAGEGPVLVLGATGMQGGAVARGLLAAGVPVRALVRDPANAQHLVAAGATLASGDFDDEAALAAACAGARAVFSMQNAPLQDPDSERRHGRAIVRAACGAGVPQMIHTSVSGAGAFHRAMPGWGAERWNDNYWESKADVEAAVREAGFDFYTILKPAFMMDNFLAAKAGFMFPDLADNALVTALLPETKLVLVASEDVGKAAVAAVIEPERFDRAEIELGSEALTMKEIAAALSAATGRTIEASSLSPAEVIARGQFPGWVNSQEWSNHVSYPAERADAERFGLDLIRFRRWATAHAAEIAVRG